MKGKLAVATMPVIIYVNSFGDGNMATFEGWEGDVFVVLSEPMELPLAPDQAEKDRHAEVEVHHQRSGRSGWVNVENIEI
jgi:hypothetical protein